MDIQKLHGEIKKAKKAILEAKNIQINRLNAWAHRRDEFVAILESLNSTFLLDLRVEAKTFTENLQSIICYWKNEPTAYSIEGKPFIKDNGYLEFKQTIDGRIQVIIGKPFIKGLVEHEENEGWKIIDTIEVSEINHESVFNYFTQYLQTIIDWGQDPERQIKGFKPGK